MAMKLRYASAAEGVADVERRRDWLLRSLREHMTPVLIQHGFTRCHSCFKDQLIERIRSPFH